MGLDISFWIIRWDIPRRKEVGMNDMEKAAFHIISDSSCDLPQELTAKENITVVPFYVSFDGEKYERELVDIKVRDFYQKMVDSPKVFPKSSMPSVQDFLDAFLPHAKAGEPIICICITSKFSGSYQSASNAKEMLLEEYPQAKIAVIDSSTDTVLQGLYVLEAIKLRNQQTAFEDAVARLEVIKSTGRIFFTVGSLDYLQHGGRIGKVASIAGSILGIRPIIVLREGEIFPGGIGRGRKSTVEKCLSLLLHYLEEEGGGFERFAITIGYGYDYEEAVAIRDMALQTLRSRNYEIDDIPIHQIGAAIGVHTGPFPVGFAVIERA